MAERPRNQTGATPDDSPVIQAEAKPLVTPVETNPVKSLPINSLTFGNVTIEWAPPKSRPSGSIGEQETSHTGLWIRLSGQPWLKSKVATVAQIATAMARHNCVADLLAALTT